jgi:pimeloyl-ACP methyl ester carboxylesterase
LNTAAWIAPGKSADWGFRLFCHPFRSKIAGTHRAFFETADLFSLRHEAQHIQGYRWGKGPSKILFVHGWQSHTYRWKKYVESLDKNQFTIYAIDGPGHGLSSGSFMTVPLYGSALEQLMQQTGRFDVVIGHSIGSFTAMYLFHQQPHLAPEKMVAMAPPGEAHEFFDFYATQLGLTNRTVGLVRARFVEVVGKAPEFFSAPNFVRTLPSAGLVIHDEEDDETPVSNAQRIHGAWKNSQLLITRGAGHNLKSPEVLEKVVAFAGGVPAGKVLPAAAL